MDLASSPLDRLRPRLVVDVLREPLQEPGVLTLVNRPQDGRGGPPPGVDHGAVGDLGRDVLPLGRLLGEAGVDDGVADEDHGQVDPKTATLIFGRIGVLGRLVADDPGLVDAVVVLVSRDPPHVRPEQGIPLGGRPDSFVQLQEDQGVVGDLLQDGGLLHRRLPLHPDLGCEEVVAQLVRRHTYEPEVNDKTASKKWFVCLPLT